MTRLGKWEGGGHLLKSMSIIQPVQDADCSGRTLATLLVAWVATAMVASILLRWEYMWIVLAVLTLLFLLVCGYTAYYVKKAHARLLLEEHRRAAIRTVSGMTERGNRREVLRSFDTEGNAPHARARASQVSILFVRNSQV